MRVEFAEENFDIGNMQRATVERESGEAVVFVRLPRLFPAAPQAVRFASYFPNPACVWSIWSV